MLHQRGRSCRPNSLINLGPKHCYMTACGRSSTAHVIGTLLLSLSTTADAKSAIDPQVAGRRLIRGGMLTLSLAVRSTEAKARLLPSAFGQQKVMDSAVAFIVCGTLNPHEALPAALKPTLDAGIIDQAIHDSRSRHVPGQPAVSTRRSDSLRLASGHDPDAGREGPRTDFGAHDRVRPVGSGASVWSLRDGGSSDVGHRWLPWLGQLATKAS